MAVARRFTFPASHSRRSLTAVRRLPPGPRGPRGPPRRCLAEDDKSEETFETHPNRTCTTVPGGTEHLALAMEAIGDQVVIGDTGAGAQHEPGRGEPFQGSLIA